jgi:parvulin-like peptidyl-prolyl isomerase
MIRSIFILIIFISSTLLFIQCGMDSKTVATVGNLKVSVDEFKEILKTRYPTETDFSKIEMKKKKEVLNQTIQKLLKVNAALDINLDEDPEIVDAIRKQEENLLGQKYFEVEIVDKLVSKKDIEEFIQRQAYELKASFILIGYNKSDITKKRTKEEARKIAQKIKEEIGKGTDFNKLAMQYSDDPAIKHNKGDYGWFRWGQKPKEFQEVCWNLQRGEVSDIFETSAGLNIIRLDDKKRDPAYVPQNDYESIFRTKKMLYSAVVDSGNKLWQAKVEELKKEKSYQFNESEVNKIAQILNEKVKNAEVDINVFTDDEKNTVLAEWDDDNIKFAKILSRYKSNLPRVLRALREPKNLKKEIQNLSLISLAIAEAKKMGLDEDEQIVKTLNNFKEDRLSYLVEQRLVNEKISFTDEDVKKYYDDNPDQFMDPAKLEMWAITVKDEALAKKVANLAKKGSNFESLSKKYSTDKYYKDKGGYLGFRTVNSRGSISRKAFEMEPNGQISEPVKYKNEWAIVKTGELNDKKLRPFQDVVKMVEGRLRNDLLKEKRNEWKAELEEKYTVKINDEVLNSI